MRGKFHPDPVWDPCFPKYPADRETACGQYWDDYYHRAERWERLFPARFRVFEVEDLNTEDGQHAILDFLDLPREARALQVGVQENQSRK